MLIVFGNKTTHKIRKMWSLPPLFVKPKYWQLGKKLTAVILNVKRALKVSLAVQILWNNSIQTSWVAEVNMNGIFHMKSVSDI